MRLVALGEDEDLFTPSPLLSQPRPSLLYPPPFPPSFPSSNSCHAL